MNRQEVFNKVYTHLLKQNAKSRMVDSFGNELHTCAYRGKDGMMCAVGCLIPDELYSPGMEMGSIAGQGSQANLVREVLGKLGFACDLGNFAGDLYFLSGLQNIHDRNDVKYWKSLLEKFAISYKLEIPNEAQETQVAVKN